MEIISIWLIHHKASLNERSPMNEDGSEYMLGTAIVPATSEKEAMILFEQYLAGQYMEIVSISGCEKYHQANFDLANEEDQQIVRAATNTLEDEHIRYIGVSSEAMESDEANNHDG